jgi:undecaprenyl diphosphate synthase
MADCLCGIIFTDVLWPDFKEQNLYEAIISYQKT